MILYMNKSLCLVFAFFLLCLINTKAQDFPMLHYTIEDGLPSNTVYDVYRDSKGILWFCTNKGVARYNGIKFDTYSTFNGLSDNEIFFSQEDVYGRIWFSTYNGQLCYYKDDTFHTAANTSFLKLPFKTSFIKGITIEKDSSTILFFMEDLKFIRILRNEVFVDSVRRKHASKWLNIVYIERLVNKTYRIFFKDKILQVDEEGNLLTNISISLDSTIVFFTTQNNIYYFNNAYIFDINGNIKKAFSRDFFKRNIINRIFYNNGIEFLATTSGLLINNDIRILNGINVSSITCDTFGNYIISTIGSGVFFIPKDYFNFKIYRCIFPKPIKYCSEIDRKIYYICDDDLYLFEGNMNRMIYGRKKNRHAIAYDSQPAYFIDKNDYYAYYENKNEVVQNIFSNSKKIYFYANDTLMGIKNVLKKNKYIYIQNRSRIRRIDYSKLNKGEDINERKAQYTVNDEMKINRIFCMAQAPDSNIWFSTVNHIYKIEEDIAVEQSMFNNISFKSFNFYDKYFVGITQDNHLHICKKRNNFLIDSVVQQNCIWEKIFKIDDYHILLSTNNKYRLIYLLPTDSTINYSIVTVENPFIPINVDGICSDKRNVYFFKNDGLTVLNINHLLAKPNPPKIFFTSIKTNNLKYSIADTIKIAYRQSANLKISFEKIVEVGHEVSQQYSISKNEKENWIDINGDEINLVNSGYGIYTVKLRAKTLSSDYCAPVRFTLIIDRPYWAKWWFITLIASFFVLIIVILARIRFRYILRRNVKAHESQVKFIKSEYKALNALMNPHFVFNTLNNVQGLVNRNDKLAANEYIRVFADLIRQNMHNLSKELIPLQKEIDLVVNYLLLERLRFKELLNYKLDIADNLDLSEIMVPPLLVQPLVENSIKHGILPLESIKGMVQINIFERAGILFIEVRDNGVGMARAEEKSKRALHESFGMDNIKKRIEQLSIILNKKIALDVSEENESDVTWTVVTIRIPNF